MIVGVGTDIVDVERIAGVYRRQGEVFAQRLLSDEELIEFQHKVQGERFLAKRWALKEAVSKALGTGIAQGVSFKEMQIDHAASGQPLLVLKGRTLEVADALGITHWAISVSDEKHHCVAFAVAEKRIS
ncbi:MULTISPECIES: holo-ACP synthase [Thiomicrorhabdus]|uniref:Holo-[acyl-carrier-protein] synthase n=1 Tax=Thiomicrorhabdus heinhorstiae TaxID=2748010 RepID=A0ABS0BVW6_9GAMM|nr:MULTISPECIES: holo-ACP synthase [Thiomicrorhabdus]MBF6057925.1 holo-ACP synthase [Thiomicrorhabdus heinhorstiae]